MHAMVWTVSCLAAIALLGPGSAHACSCIPVWMEGGWPLDGARNVPIDAHPWLRAFATRASDVVLEDEQGNAVAATVTLRAGGDGGHDCLITFAEIAPTEFLAPGTRYTIRVLGDAEVRGSRSRSFTTGETASEPEALAAPKPRLAILDAPGERDSCIYTPYRACLGAPGAEVFDVTVLRHGEPVESFFMHDTKDLVLDDPSDVCFEVRKRDTAGRRSPAATICSDEVTVRPAAEGDFPAASSGPNCDLNDGILATVEDGIEERDDDPRDNPVGDASANDVAEVSANDDESSPNGCSVRSPGAARAGLALAWPWCIAWLLAARRRRQA